MTNQMKLILKIGLVGSGVALIVSLAGLIFGGVGFLHTISYVILGFASILFVLQLILFVITLSEYRLLKRRIAYYKLLKNLRNKAVLDFYHRFGLIPQYDKDGRLLTPDELLGILTKLDAEGNLDPSVYEMLGIFPQFDKDGKEIPTIIVLKHIIKNIKKEGIKDLKNLKGLYLKGSKKEKPKEKKSAPAKAKKEEAKKGKKAQKSAPFGSPFFEDRKRAKFSFKFDQPKKDKGGKKPEPQRKSQKPVVEPEKKQGEKPIITKVGTDEMIHKTDYFQRTQKLQTYVPAKPQPVRPKESGAELGECTPD